MFLKIQAAALEPDLPPGGFYSSQYLQHRTQCFKVGAQQVTVQATEGRGEE